VYNYVYLFGHVRPLPFYENVKQFTIYFDKQEITPVTNMLKYATKHHINVTVSSGVSTKICDKNVSLKAEKVYPKN
jgi:hypothetical protein